MSKNGRQFDPVASAATAALNTTQRSLRRVRSQTDAPQLPAESQAFTNARNAVQSVSQFSPMNVLARGDSPIPQPDQMGLGDLPGPQDLIPGQGGQGGLPNPQDVMPGNSGGSGSTRDGTAENTSTPGGRNRRNNSETRT